MGKAYDTNMVITQIFLAHKIEVFFVQQITIFDHFE
jgi:hypothetical protein